MQLITTTQLSEGDPATGHWGDWGLGTGDWGLRRLGSGEIGDRLLETGETRVTWEHWDTGFFETKETE